MSPERTGTKEGAGYRLVPSPYGNKAKRAEWEQRIAGLSGLAEAVPLLLEWRESHRDEPVTDQDDLWIEARLEEVVAEARFEEMTNDQIRTETLTDEKVAEVIERYQAEADAASVTPGELERIVSEFRSRYRPPIMPSSPFMRAETELAEVLMKARELDWYDQSLDELREARGVIVHKKGINK